MCIAKYLVPIDYILLLQCTIAHDPYVKSRGHNARPRVHCTVMAKIIKKKTKKKNVIRTYE